jgi:hypothetical protein
MADQKDTKDLTEGFAFVAATAVPKREISDRLAEYREQNKEARLVAGRKVSKGLLSGKALTDNVVYETNIEAVRVSSRAKALVNPALAESGMRASVSTTGNDDDGYRWFIVSKPLPPEEAE